MRNYDYNKDNTVFNIIKISLLLLSSSSSLLYYKKCYLFSISFNTGIQTNKETITGTRLKDLNGSCCFLMMKDFEVFRHSFRGIFLLIFFTLFSFRAFCHFEEAILTSEIIYTVHFVYFCSDFHKKKKREKIYTCLLLEQDCFRSEVLAQNLLCNPTSLYAF